jgi:hypothetical protein
VKVCADCVWPKAKPGAVLGHCPVEGARAMANIKQDAPFARLQNVLVNFPLAFVSVGLG